MTPMAVTVVFACFYSVNVRSPNWFYFVEYVPFFFLQAPNVNVLFTLAVQIYEINLVKFLGTNMTVLCFLLST